MLDRSRVSWHLRNRIFRLSKCRRVTQRKLDTLDPRLSWPLKNHIINVPMVDMKAVAWSGGFNDTAKIAFWGRQSEERLINRSHMFLNQESHDLQDSHFQATKRPNRDCGCLITSVITFLVRQKATNVFTISHVHLISGCLNLTGKAFSGHLNVEYGSQDVTFTGHQMSNMFNR